MSGFKTLPDGERVSFDVEESDRGPVADEVRPEQVIPMDDEDFKDFWFSNRPGSYGLGIIPVIFHQFFHPIGHFRYIF